MDFCGRDAPYFSPHFLGEKFPVFDHLVNVVDGEIINAIFFAQVRTTSKGYVTRADGKRYLRVAATKDDLNAMVAYPGPAYLFGVDEVSRAVYAMAVDKLVESGFAAMPTEHRLDCESLPLLWAEVKAYWSGIGTSFSSRFVI
jgi:hypothetical protein